MAKKADDSVLDAALNDLKNNCDKMTICAGEPATYAAAITGGANFLADQAMASGDYTVANGDTSGRKATVAAKSSIPVDNSGTADHVALLDTVNLVLKYVTTLSAAQAVTSGNTANTSAWDIEIADPA